MKNIFKAMFASFMWIAFMSLTKESLSVVPFWLFLISGIVFFNLLFDTDIKR